MFENCISLGFYCGTALSMSKMGLRSSSGPFDWCLSDIEPVLKMIETDFAEFMLRDNLHVNEKEHKVFEDGKYGFYFNHEIDKDFDDEYPEIYLKYARRVARFVENIKSPTCFIRAVKSKQEVEYINKNQEYINRVIKKSNPQNAIVFLTVMGMDDITSDFLNYRLNVAVYSSKIYDMRNLFATSPAFLKYCGEKILSITRRKSNILYSNNNMNYNVKAALVINDMEANSPVPASLLKKYMGESVSGIYIWGAGVYGSTAVKYMRRLGVCINAVIDNDANKHGTYIDGVEVVSIRDVKLDNAYVFISVGDEKKHKAIAEQIVNMYPECKIISYDRLYDVDETEDRTLDKGRMTI